MRKRTFARAGVAAVTAALLAVAAPLAASAHVRVAPDQAEPGTTAQLTFRVPTESATASTVALTIALPTDTPFTSASAETMPGWTVEVTRAQLPTPVTVDGTKITEAPHTIVWTADGAGIPPGQFAQFTVRLGPVPDTGSVLLPAIQMYSDGTVVSWNEPTPASGDEPEHPAPTLYVNDAPPGDDTGATASAAAPAASDPTALWLGLGGLVLGAVAVLLAVIALVRRPGRTG